MVKYPQKIRWDFIGLSTDTKPTPATSEDVTNGSTFYCSDTSKLYIWYKDKWYEKASSGGTGTSDFNELTNRPKYNGETMSSTTDIPAVPTVVQSTGQSTTDVMSQKAVTDIVGDIETALNLINNGSAE